MKSKINIRTIFKISLEEILELKKSFIIVYEDGSEIDMYYKDIIYMRFLFDFINKYPIKLTKKYNLRNYYNNNYANKKVYIKLYSLMFRDVAMIYRDKPEYNDVISALFKDMYIAINNVNKILIGRIIEYAINIEITDLMEIQFNEELILSMVKLADDNTPANVNNTYKTLDKIIREDRYKNNLMQMLYLADVLSLDQVRQLLASRGYVTEINSKIFNKPMINSFVLGFKNIYEAAIESRAGAKAMFLSNITIQNNEYLARQIQLATMVLEDVYFGDCGNPTYKDFYVRPKEISENGNVIYKGDLEGIIGKRYLDDDGVEKIIQGDEKHLEGKYIKLRMAVYCSYRNKHKICSACIGEVAYSIFKHQNLGHMVATDPSSKASQTTLSAKHLTKSASSSMINLTDEARKYFMVKNNEKIFFKAGVLNKKVKKVYLKFKQSEAWGLDNIIQVKNIFNININKISRLSEVYLVFKTNKEETSIRIPLNIDNKYAYFTIDFLSYVIKNGYSVYDEEYYIIDINNYNNKRPIFFYEKVEFDVTALATEFKKLLKTRNYKLVDGRIRSEYYPHILVQKIYELLNRKINVNISVIDAMVYPFTVQNLSERNFDLGRNSPYKDVVKFKEAIDFRSIGGSYDWDDLQSKILDPMLYIEKNKPAHPMDVFFCPNEVLKYDVDAVNK